RRAGGTALTAAQNLASCSGLCLFSAGASATSILLGAGGICVRGGAGFQPATTAVGPAWPVWRRNTRRLGRLTALARAVSARRSPLPPLCACTVTDDICRLPSR